MKEFGKQIILFFIFCLCLMRLGAQNTDTRIQKRFAKFSELNVNEKLFAHCDKIFYLAGEIMWFKLYCVDGKLHQPIDMSKVAYVEILDKEYKPVVQAKIHLADGFGNGSFYLPPSLPTGVYTFRAYTQWMKNFPADYHFQKSITIVNSLRNLDEQPPKKVVYQVSFFPEGGNMVESIESKIGFKISDQWGNSAHGKGVVLDQANDTVARFEPLKFGIGQFKLTPLPGHTYKAIVTIHDTVVIDALPTAQPQGYTMTVSSRDESTLGVIVKSNIASATNVHLFVHTRQFIKISEQKTLSGGTAEFIIEKNKLGEGISHLTIFNNAAQPVCERLYFVRPTKKLNIHSSVNNQQFSARSKVNIDVVTSDEANRARPAFMSASVYRLQPNDGAENNIVSYFWLTSELRGKVESPGYYLSSPTAEGDEALDNLMLTHGWRRFHWMQIWESTNSAKKFVPELTGHIIHGKVTNATTGLPASNVIAYLSVPGNRIQLYSSRSNSVGEVRFYTRDFYGPNEILLQAGNGNDTVYRVELTNPFSEEVPSTPSRPFQISNELKDPLIENSISVQVQNAFFADKLKQLYVPDVDSTAFYGRPDKEYMLDDYVRFSTMEEVLREYVAEVLVRRQKENFRLMIANSRGELMLENPITLFNGVPVFETNKIMQYDPLKVKKIEVINGRYFYGPTVLNGIVNFTTYQPDPNMISGLNAIVSDYEGLQFSREFYSPVYETAEQLSNRVPDFRNVLYWSGNVKSGTTGKSGFEFYTSDQKGKYIVVLQGVSGDGRFGHHVMSFIVN